MRFADRSRRFSLICLMIFVVAFVATNLTYCFSPYHSQLTSYERVYGVVMRSFRLFSILIPSMYYTIVLRSIHQRLAELNSSIRFTTSFIFILNRRRFIFNGNKHNEVSVNVVKRIGRNHCVLIDILDEANICFSFQVWYLLNDLVFFFNLTSSMIHFILIIN